MLVWQAALGEDSVSSIANYMLQMIEVNSESHPGKTLYDQNCSACHGEDGSGNAILGAPYLTDDI